MSDRGIDRPGEPNFHIGTSFFEDNNAVLEMLFCGVTPAVVLAPVGGAGPRRNRRVQELKHARTCGIMGPPSSTTASKGPYFLDKLSEKSLVGQCRYQRPHIRLGALSYFGPPIQIGSSISGFGKWAFSACGRLPRSRRAIL